MEFSARLTNTNRVSRSSYQLERYNALRHSIWMLPSSLSLPARRSTGSAAVSGKLAYPFWRLCSREKDIKSSLGKRSLKRYAFSGGAAGQGAMSTIAPSMHDSGNNRVIKCHELRQRFRFSSLESILPLCQPLRQPTHLLMVDTIVDICNAIRGCLENPSPRS